MIWFSIACLVVGSAAAFQERRDRMRCFGFLLFSALALVVMASLISYEAMTR